MKLNKIYNTDFLNNTLQDKSVDLIIADPPYYEVKGEFDFIWSSFEDYLKDVELWAKECKRVLKDNGSLFWYGDAKKIAYSQIILDKYFNLENSLIWENTNPHKQQIRFSKDLRSFAPLTERILFYSNEDYLTLTNCIYSIREYLRAEIIKSKGKIVLKEINKALGASFSGGGIASDFLSLKKTSPVMITKDNYIKLQKYCFPYLRKEYEELRKEYEELRKEYEELRRYFNNSQNLGDVIKFPNYETNSFKHPTQKPEKLTASLILTTSREGATVLVPFAGSGTECAMAAKYKRNFIAFEIDSKYQEIAQKRANYFLSTPQLF